MITMTGRRGSEAAQSTCAYRILQCNCMLCRSLPVTLDRLFKTDDESESLPSAAAVSTTKCPLLIRGRNAATCIALEVLLARRGSAGGIYFSGTFYIQTTPRTPNIHNFNNVHNVAYSKGRIEYKLWGQKFVGCQRAKINDGQRLLQ